MTFLTPWSALVAAAITLPLLALLYFLKLRRQRLAIPSTLLWRKSFEDLQVNAPFQRLRWSVLLLLQLLLLLTMLAAFAQPMLSGDVGTASRVVLIIDRSASMNTIIATDEKDRPRTRLDAAKDAAKDAVDHLMRGGTPTQIMVLAYGANAQVASTYASNRGVLRDAIDGIQPADEESNLDAALQLAGAFTNRDESLGEQSAEPPEPPEVVLISDGGVSPPRDGRFSLRSGTFRFVQAGAESSLPADNLGVASFSARREYEDPSTVLVFARLANASDAPIQTVITLTVDGQPLKVIRKTVPPATANGAGEEPLTATLNLPGGAVLTIRHNHADQMPSDNEAHLVMPPPTKPRIALVYPDTMAEQPSSGRPNPFLEELLTALEPQKLQTLSRSQYEAIDSAEIDSGSRYDLVVFDRVSPTRLPGVPSLTMGAAPAGVTVKPQDRPGGRYILSWERQHPLMRQVSLDTVVYANFGGYDLPTGATALAMGPEGPVIALLRSRGASHVLVGFSLETADTNWPLHVSLTVFMQNALDYLTLAAEGQSNAGLVAKPGEPMTVRAKPGTRELKIEPFGSTAKAPVISVPISGGSGSIVTLPALRRAGLYTIAGAAPPHERLAVSLLSDVESDNRPRGEVTVNSETARATHAGAAAARPIWPWLVMAGLALLVIEWLVYCARVRGVV